MKVAVGISCQEKRIVPFPLAVGIFKRFNSLKLHMLRNLSAASIFSHFLENSNSVLSIVPEKKEPKKPKCEKCCEKLREFCSCSRRKRISSKQAEAPEWEEDLGRAEKRVTKGFTDWLNHTYRTDRKSPAIVRKQRMKARRSWYTSVAMSLNTTNSILSIKGYSDTQVRDIDKIMADIALWSFDSFRLDELSNRHSFAFVTREIFIAQDFMRKFRIKPLILKNLISALEAGYMMHGNQYHNQRHGADVTQTVYAILNTRPGLYTIFTDLEIFALIFAAMVHDLAHPGTTNNFQINTQSHLAILYNDRSVLENHHAASAFQILRNHTCNILQHLKTDEFKEFRDLVIQCVLSTDMATHFQDVKAVRAFLKVGEWDGTSNKAISTALSFILHSADISNPGKPWDTHIQCADALMLEFEAQGIREKTLKIPVSPLCDPKDQTAATQVMFIEVIVQPTLQAMGDLLDMILAANPENEVVVAKDAERRRFSSNMESIDSKAILNPPKNQRLSMLENLRSFNVARASKQQDKTTFLTRPWVPHLAANISEWNRRSEMEHHFSKPRPKSQSTPPPPPPPPAQKKETELKLTDVVQLARNQSKVSSY